MALLVIGLLIDASSGRPFPEPTVERRQQRSASDMDGNNSESDNDVDPFGNFPVSDDSDVDPFAGLVNYTEPPTTTGCFDSRQETRVYITMEEGKEVKRNVTRTIRTCCDGYTGDDCVELVPTPKPVSRDESDPCNGLECEGNENAFCAVVSKCGRNFPLFLTENGQLAVCANQPTDLNSIVCTGTCTEKPCAGKSCPLFPDAQCLTSGCDCKAMWILPSGVQVDCLSGEHVSPETARNRRQTRDPTNCSK